MSKFVLMCGSAVALLLAWTLAGTEAEARTSWSGGDYAGNEWIGDNLRQSNGNSDDAAPARKRSRAANVSSDSDDEPKPQRRQRQRQPRSESVASGGSSYQSGIASYYWQPQRVASGGWFNPNAMTAAHKTLPFGTRVRVTHRSSGRSVTVTINDRGPYIAGRVIDLSLAAAGALGIKGSGVAPVELAVLGR